MSAVAGCNSTGLAMVRTLHRGGIEGYHFVGPADRQIVEVISTQVWNGLAATSLWRNPLLETLSGTVAKGYVVPGLGRVAPRV